MESLFSVYISNMHHNASETVLQEDESASNVWTTAVCVSEVLYIKKENIKYNCK